ncbi:MAG: ABC transporter ATP-binding protein [Candidatus Omnitrophota bacterium]
MAEQSPAIIKVCGLGKEFRSSALFSRARVRAVWDLNFEVRRGEIFGFLGPNGAGKTTTLHLLTGISKPSAGSIELFGKAFRCPQTWPLERIGFVPENTLASEYLTVTEILTFFSRIYGLTDDVTIDRIQSLLEMTGLTQERFVLVRKLSMGQRRLVDFMLALVNDPDIIFLDEPTVYLDPLAVERFREAVLILKNRGKTIFMSSHTLPLIEKLSDRIALISKGRVLKIGERQDFLRQGSMEEEFLRLIKEDR